MLIILYLQNYGSVSTWTTATLVKLGGITSGLMADNVKELNLSGLEAASVVGYSGDWKKEGVRSSSFVYYY
jgi:hypothetical protein